MPFFVSVSPVRESPERSSSLGTEAGHYAGLLRMDWRVLSALGL